MLNSHRIYLHCLHSIFASHSTPFTLSLLLHAQVRGTWMIVKRNRNGQIHRRELRIREDAINQYSLYNYSDGGRFLKKKFPLTSIVQVRGGRDRYLFFPY